MADGTMDVQNIGDLIDRVAVLIADFARPLDRATTKRRRLVRRAVKNVAAPVEVFEIAVAAMRPKIVITFHPETIGAADHYAADQIGCAIASGDSGAGTP